MVRLPRLTRTEDLLFSFSNRTLTYKRLTIPTYSLAGFFGELPAHAVAAIVSIVEACWRLGISRSRLPGICPSGLSRPPGQSDR